MTSKNPDIRFKGFTDAWEQRKLGESYKINMGQSPKGENYTENPKDHILVQGNADMKNGRVVPRIWTTQVTKQAAPGDIIISVRAPVGDVGKTDFYVVLGRGVSGIKGNEFIYQTLIRLKKLGYWTRYSTGSTFESINSTDLKDALINLPCDKEQNKIGMFFKCLDKTIALHQHELTLLKQRKKAFLQKMFPINGENIPRIRFSEFNKPWENFKLSTLIDYKNGRGNEGNQSNSGKYQLVNLNSISIEGGLKDSGKYINETSETLQKNDLVMILSDIGHGDLLGRVALIPQNNKYVLNQRVALLRPNEKTNPLYLLTHINQNQRYFKRQGAGMSQLNISKGSVENFESYYPDIKEQSKIGNFFKQLDELITLQEQKLESLKQMKKALLQKMFV